MPTTDDEGWVKVHRKIEKSAVFQNEGLLKVWVWCLLRANYEDRWIPVKTGRGETQVFVKRGQFIFGRKTAAKALKMDESTVYKRMQKLENMQNLNTQSNSHYSIITICNYDLYQMVPEEEGTDKVTPKEHPSNTTKKDKHLKNTTLSGKKTPDSRVKEFFDFWGDAFLQETGQPYVFSFGKDGKLIKDLLKVHPPEVLHDTARHFFKDERCKQRGFTIGIFFQEINRLLGMRAMDPLEQAKRELRRNGNAASL